jgi:RNA-binding protein
MDTLTGRQKRWLRAQAHHLDPVVIVGQQGLSGPVVEALEQALAEHELIKVRFGAHQARRKELAAEMEAKLGCRLAGMVGHVAILYRPHPDPDRRGYAPPGPDSL